MGKIIAINKSKTISYRDNVIEYFEEVNNNSKKEDYQKIIDKIKNATSIVKIASTSMIDEQIIDAIHENKELNAYIILKDFSKSNQTVQRFDERRVAIIREVDELENNFILIDNVAYLFINPLEESQNISLYFDESKTSDLEFIFNYYFWNRATKEKLVNSINRVTESPFPPFGLRRQKSINVVESIDYQSEELYIPRDKKFNNILENNATQKYFSDDIVIPIYLNDSSFTVGVFKVEEIFNIENRWQLKEDKLDNISSSLEIIPRNEQWIESITITANKNIALPSIKAKTIDGMKNIKPDSYPKEKYIKDIKYSWEVLPPIVPKGAKKASLYKEHEQFELKKEQYKGKEKKIKSIKNDIKKLEDKISVEFTLKQPKYALPTVGVLWELKNKYYLEIEFYEELDEAKKVLKSLEEMDCLVVVAS